MAGGGAGGTVFSLKSLAVFENHGTVGLGGMGGLGGIVCAVDGPWLPGLDARAFAGVGLGEGLARGGLMVVVVVVVVVW